MPVDADLDPGTERRLESYVTEWMGDDGVPGASVAAVEGTDLRYAEGFGARDPSGNRPATPDTLYGIGSWKSFVATAVLQRAAAGDLALSDPVDDCLPHLEGVPGDPVTVEELPSHTSGMPSDGNLPALVTRLTGVDDANVPLTSDDDFRRHVREFAAELQATVPDDRVESRLSDLPEDDAERVRGAALYAEPVEPFDHDQQTHGSTEVGGVSWTTPTGQFRGATWPVGTPGHSWQVVAANGDFGLKGVASAATVLAGATYDLLADPERVAAANEEFAAAIGPDAYETPLPEEAEPPFDVTAMGAD